MRLSIKGLIGMIGKKQSTISPFLNLDLPAGNRAQIFDFTKDLILKDSCPFKISTSIFPLLVELICF